MSSSLNLAVSAALAIDGPLAQKVSGYRYRQAQEGLSLAIAAAIENHKTLIAEAGTGTGKTFAYLVPALLSNGRVLISTGTKTLQDQLFNRDLPVVMKALDLRPTVALLKGRANYICWHFLKKNLHEGRFEKREDAAALRRIESFANITQHGDRGQVPSVDEGSSAWAYATATADSCLGSDCADYARCFVVKARQEAAAADIVVVNHHLLCADMSLREEGVAELLPTVDTIVFDEAHQLPDIATQFFGEAVSTRQIIELARDSLRVGITEAKDSAPWTLLHEKLIHRVRELRLAAGYPRRIDVAQISEELITSLDQLREQLLDLSAVLNGAADRGKEIEHVALRAHKLLQRIEVWTNSNVAQDPDLPFAAWIEVSSGGVILQRAPLSVAKSLREQRLRRPQAWVMLSATLTVAKRFDHFVEQIGADDAQCLSCESPFDYQQQALLYLPKALGNPNQQGYSKRLLDCCWPLIQANGGRAFVLCTSLRMVAELADLMTPIVARQPQFMLIVQGTAPRAQLLEQFRKASHPVLVGSASFWEGVDVVGSQLSLVIIDKLPFASPDDPLLKARSDALQKNGGNPFNELQLPAAALALKQGAGRLIRSEGDRGMLVLADERLTSKGYGKSLLSSLPNFARTNDAAVALEFLSKA